MESCKNCENLLEPEFQFCPSCGQKTKTERIDFKFLVHEIQHSIFHIDKGIFFTLKELFLRPGYSIKEYLDGKRTRHFKPALLIIILGGLCGLLRHFLDNGTEGSRPINFDFKNTSGSLNQYGDVDGFFRYLQAVFGWFSDHFAFTILILIPFAGLSYYLGFKKFKLNYAEWLVATCFFTGQLLAVDFFIILFEGVFQTSFTILFLVIALVLNLWTIFQLFDKNSKLNLFIRTLWSYILYGFFYVLALAFFAIIVALIGAMMYGNEGLLNKIS